MGQIPTMDHNEALQQMATERYLLNEMPPELRESFEEHMFDCYECAMDVRAAAAFAEEATVQLPQILSTHHFAASNLAEASPDMIGVAKLSAQAISEVAQKQVLQKKEVRKQNRSANDWFAWLRPTFSNLAFAAPIFAALLVVIGYQNLFTMPGMRVQANEPRLQSLVTLRGATRGGEPVNVLADRKEGVAFRIPLPVDSGYASYVFTLYDAGEHTVWSRTFSAPTGEDAADGMFSLTIPTAQLKPGMYTLAVGGQSKQGDRADVMHQAFHLNFKP